MPLPRWRFHVVAAGLCGQQKSQAQLEALRDEKLAKPVFQRVAWQTDFDAARKQAAESDKPIFAYFTRSYAP